MTDLVARHCSPAPPGTPRLSSAQATALLQQAPGFRLEADGTRLAATFEFKNYYETMAFVNAVAYLSHREDHHPNLEVGYKTCKVEYYTHTVGGLTENDFICAAKVSALLA